MLKINIVIWWHSIKSWQVAISMSAQTWAECPSKYCSNNVSFASLEICDLMLSYQQREDFSTKASKLQECPFNIYNMKLNQTQEINWTNKCHIWWIPSCFNFLQLLQMDEIIIKKCSSAQVHIMDYQRNFSLYVTATS